MMEKRSRAAASGTKLDGGAATALVDGPVDDEQVAGELSDEGVVSDEGAEPAVTAAPDGELYSRLAAPFDVTFRDLRGGVELEYITGEQATTRLYVTLGFLNWSFRIVEHGIHAEADECWALGEITVMLEGRTVTRQQFGSQKIKRSRASGTPLDIGFDLKGAATDALKKCASLIGVALYLWKKEPPVGLGAGAPVPIGSFGANGGSGAAGPRPVNGTSVDPEALYCEECGEALTETRFKDGTNWAPAQLAVFGRRKHSRILCMSHYREANQAKRRAEEALQQVPF
jgi:hypothetical protein